jgi:hypothetical protein
MSTPQKVREIALGLPDAVEVETWGHPTFQAGGHIFVGLDEDTKTANINATRETQAALVAERPDVFRISPRVGKSGWITINLADIPAHELRKLITRAWELTSPGK